MAGLLKGIKEFFRGFVPRRRLPFLRQYYYRIRGRLYTGKKVYCPICDRGYRRFLSVGSERVCPGCGSCRRHRLLLLYLQRETCVFRDPSSVLHVGTSLTLTRYFSGWPNLAYVSADLNETYVDVNVDLRDLPFPSESFDFVICFHVLEHVEEDLRSMGELYRVLRPGGLALIQVPLDPARGETYEDPSVRSPSERERLFGQQDHVRVYGRDFPLRLASAGFRVEYLDYAAGLHRADIGRFGLSGARGFHLCRKPKEP